MHAADIKAQLEKRGYALTDIAKQVPSIRGGGTVTVVSVSCVVKGLSRSENIENRIAAVLGLAKSQIWPQWYDAKGGRITTRSARRSTTRKLALANALRDRVLG